MPVTRHDVFSVFFLFFLFFYSLADLFRQPVKAITHRPCARVRREQHVNSPKNPINLNQEPIAQKSRTNSTRRRGEAGVDPGSPVLPDRTKILRATETRGKDRQPNALSEVTLYAQSRIYLIPMSLNMWDVIIIVWTNDGSMHYRKAAALSRRYGSSC